MAFDINSHRKDDQKESGGVWEDWMDGSRCLIASTNSSKYQRVLQRISKKYQAQFRRRTIDPDLMRSVFCEAYAETILLDWEGFEAGGQKLMPTKENKILALKEIPDFYEFVEGVAADNARFSQEVQEEDEGNLSNA